MHHGQGGSMPPAGCMASGKTKKRRTRKQAFSAGAFLRFLSARGGRRNQFFVPGLLSNWWNPLKKGQPFSCGEAFAAPHSSLTFHTHASQLKQVQVK